MIIWCNASNTKPENGQQIVGWCPEPRFLSPAGPELGQIRRSHFVIQHYEGELHPDIVAWAYLNGPDRKTLAAFGH